MQKNMFSAGTELNFSQLEDIVNGRTHIKLNTINREKVRKARVYLDKITQNPNRIIYGVNTGFGSLCNSIIRTDELEQLQYNLLKSHACGMGLEIDPGLVKRMLILKIQSLSMGYSGIQDLVIDRLVYFLENDILPVVYENGSLGASGDLAPLSHLALPLIGLGDVNYKGVRCSAAEMYAQEKISPLSLRSKEGLALINGTQFMLSYASFLTIGLLKLIRISCEIAALSCEVFKARPDPFDEWVGKSRNHVGQTIVAKWMRELFAGSENMNTPRTHVQDPYSFRCIPQVIGASLDVYQYASQIVMTEINSVTDNPLVFPDEDKVISGGNFHGQTLALVMDHIGLAMHEIASISERRIYLLISGQRDLPAFLTPRPGIQSGFMIPQYTAASLVSLNKQLCTPSSADSIMSSNGQEDHVSMGANAGLKAMKIYENCKNILSIEWLTAAQASGFRKNEKFSPKVTALIHEINKSIPFLSEDEIMYPLLRQASQILTNRLETINTTL